MPSQELNSSDKLMIETSPFVQEIVSAKPDFLVRKGIMLLFVLILLLLLGSWFITYPDALEGEAIITTNPLPIKLKSISGGRIARLFVTDGAMTTQQTPIAEIENLIGYQNIITLQHTIDSITICLQTNNDSTIEPFIDNPLQSLGDAQQFYNQLLQQLSAKRLLVKEQLYNKRKQNLQHQIANLKTIAQISKQEKKIIEDELKQSNDRFKANEKLYTDKVISEQEYYDEAAKWSAKKLQLEQQKRNSIQISINSDDNNKQMLEIQYEREEKERGLTVGIQEAIRNINNYIQSWKQRYLIVAPYNGTVQYLRPLQLNEPTNIGEELFAIVPQKSTCLAIIMLPANGIGKIALGQNVHLLLDNFPYNEFGFLEGKVIKRSSLPESIKSISEAAQQTVVYRIYVQLPQKLITSYHKTIPFTPEMTAKARIITNERNLLQRLFQGIAKLDK